MSTQEQTGWVRQTVIATHLGVSPRTLRRLMDRTPEGTDRPWVNVSSGPQPRYRWQSTAAAQRWYLATCRSINPVAS